jgi:hypothetical protein
VSNRLNIPNGDLGYVSVRASPSALAHKESPRADPVHKAVTLSEKQFGQYVVPRVLVWAAGVSAPSVLPEQHVPH